MGQILVLIMIGAVCVFLFWLCREFVCAYFKVNEIVELLKAISQKLGPDKPAQSAVAPNGSLIGKNIK